MKSSISIIQISRGMLVGVWLTSAAISCAQTVYVDVNTGNDGNSGADWANAVRTISNGIAKAGSGYTILVATGLYQVTSNIVVTNNLTLRSWNAGAIDPTNTIVDGQGVTRALYMSNALALAAGFTLCNGNGIGSISVDAGGGAYISAGVLSNCIVRDNWANLYGGGVCMEGTNTYVKSCLILRNWVTNIALSKGGGVYINATGGTLLDSFVALNTNVATNAYSGGGGVYVNAANRGFIVGCTVSNNFANSGGGILVRQYGNVISNTVVENFVSNAWDNAYSYGGGIFLYSARKGAVCTDNTIRGNIAYTDGGGIYIFPEYTAGLGGALVSNCTIVDNVSSTGFGGGLRVYISSPNYTNTAVMVTDCRIAGNRVLASSGALGSRGGGGVAWDAPGLLKNCFIVSNQADRCSAGGLFSRRQYETWTNEELVIRNCLVFTNTARMGGGVLVYNSNTNKAIRMENCTIVGNVGTQYAGGVCVAVSPNASMTNVIVYHNIAPGSNADVYSTNASFYLGYCCTPTTNDLVNTVNVITNDPDFISLPTGNLHLKAYSPCLNAGSIQDWMAEACDLDGQPRIDRLIKRVDMGCYERLPRGILTKLR